MAILNIPPSVDEIVNRQLFLGNLSAAMSSELRTQLGITHILSVCPEFPSTGPNHLMIAVDDSEYDDLLIRLPEACKFIQKALGEGGRVLVHCVMGVSRSATVLSAFLMQSRKFSPSQALEFIRSRRPCVQPNYGFLKQLHAFAQCGHHPSAEHPAYISWKRRQEQDVTVFLNQMIDTIPVIRQQLYLSSELPDDVEQVQSLLFEFGITHLLSISPSATVPSLSTLVRHHHIPDSQQERDTILLVLPETCNFIRQAISDGGVVLVYSEMESKAVLASYGYLMSSRGLTPKQVYQQLTEALPLFNRSSNFTRQLELFDACSFAPTSDHPLIEEWLNSGASSGWNSRRGSSNSTEVAAALSATALSILSDTGLDGKAFGDTLHRLQSSPRMSKSPAKLQAIEVQS
ncbi:protein-tyrosine phosphatase-like protein [Lentinula aff. detonsa]|uniref:protein-tyrosine-phosphatase n=1 Tax=Lentinula aff. detonsa TaxID=2804958 RepID=A0AA38NMZ3_9AGAR|nr:protein-tyrosine phosphatase-like protein [Lentinula aff. detonsa]KAJ3796645.1 protein-tyrosine phosphatase-like protein [Lentinula aff. detonsa]